MKLIYTTIQRINIHYSVLIVNWYTVKAFISFRQRWRNLGQSFDDCIEEVRENNYGFQLRSNQRIEDFGQTLLLHLANMFFPVHRYDVLHSTLEWS